MATDNKTLGRFVLDGIPPAPRGIPQIEVVFTIDANGILNVNAKDLATNKEQKITITASTGLKEDEIEQMVQDAEKYAEEDRKKKERAEKRNNADSLCFSIERLLKESGDKIEDSDKKDLEEGVEEIKKLIEKDDFDEGEVESKVDSLTERMQEVSKKMYEKASEESAEKSDEKESEEKEEEVKEGEVVGEE